MDRHRSLALRDVSILHVHCLYILRNVYMYINKLFNLPPRVLKARHLSGSALVLHEEIGMPEQVLGWFPLALGLWRVCMYTACMYTACMYWGMYSTGISYYTCCSEISYILLVE